MARYQFDDRSGDAEDLAERGARFLNLVVRTFGFALMLVGLWIGFSVIAQAWMLYRQPQNIERFVVAVEKGSNLDRVIASVARVPETTVPGLVTDDLAADPAPGAAAATRGDNPPPLRLSYFVAWILALLLLMLIGRLAIAAIKTGGELALYEVQVRRFAQALVRESARAGSR